MDQPENENENEAAEQNRDQIHLGNPDSKKLEYQVSDKMGDECVVHGIEPVKFPSTEKNLVSCVISISSRIPVGASTCAQGFGGICREMKNAQGEKGEKKKKREE